MKKYLLALLVITLVSCTDKSGAEKTLTDQGYTDVKVGGYGLLSCSRGDNFSTKFTAKTPNNTHISGVVCSGIFKGSTIRFD